MLPVMSTSMTFQEKRLYHQIHPLKLATDIGATIRFLYLLWERKLLLALLVVGARSTEAEFAPSPRGQAASGPSDGHHRTVGPDQSRPRAWPVTLSASATVSK